MYIYPGAHHSQYGWRPSIDTHPSSLVNRFLARLQNPSVQPNCPLRSRHLRSGSTVSRHLRRNATMEEDWLQNISDLEDINYFNSPVLQGRTGGLRSYFPTTKFTRNDISQPMNITNGMPLSRLSRDPTFGSEFDQPKVEDGSSLSDSTLDLHGLPPPASYMDRASTPPTPSLPLLVNMSDVHNPDTFRSPMRYGSAPLLVDRTKTDIDALPQTFSTSVPLKLDVPDSGLPTHLEQHLEKQCSDHPNWVSQWCKDSTSSPAAYQNLYHHPLTPTSMASKESGDDASSVASGGNFALNSLGYQPSISRASSLSMFPMEDNGTQTAQVRHKLPTAPTSIPLTATIPAMTKTTAKRARVESSEDEFETEDDESGLDEDYDCPSQRKRPRVELPAPSFAKSSRDTFLVKAREAGMSYKDIKIQGRFSEAESTLRGRFRTLTKDKDDRVRKPHWTDRDIELLKEYVRKICRGRDPCSVKIPWKEVANYIVDQGGSYHFGNATCRKKWDEIFEESS